MKLNWDDEYIGFNVLLYLWDVLVRNMQLR